VDAVASIRPAPDDIAGALRTAGEGADELIPQESPSVLGQSLVAAIARGIAKKRPQPESTTMAFPKEGGGQCRASKRFGKLIFKQLLARVDGDASDAWPFQIISV
jgi:hypothetical protein